MVTQVGKQNTIEELVESLLNLEFDAIAAYDETINRLDDESYAAQISEFREDHYRHVRELTEVARVIGVEVPDGTAKSMLTKGKVVIADMMGDRAILMAMKTNEEDTVSAYDAAHKNPVCTPELKRICNKGLRDEQRHRDWMSRTAQQIKKVA